MTTTLPSPITEAAALSVAGDGAQRYALGTALVAAGADATVVLVEAGDHGPGIEGVQDAATVLLRGAPVTGLHARFVRSAAPPIHVYTRLDGACLPLGRAVAARAEPEPPASALVALQLERPLGRALLDLVRPVPAPGPMPDVDWVDEVEALPLRALESFALGWFPAREPTREAAELGPVPPALEAFHRLARLRPALLDFTDPVLERPRRASGPLGGRLVFAEWLGGGMDWSVPWPPEGPAKADPRVWHTEDPHGEPESSVEAEPLSRFLLQFTLYEALNSAPYQAWAPNAPAGLLAPLLRLLRPVPLSPHLPAHHAVRFHVAPGLIAGVSGDGREAVVTFGALHRAVLTPLADRGFEWRRFDG
ncbi:hypothetical protein [Streptomyces sp. NRRL WC-3742]|uniref:hypothetical protein n=1 Tax=Streptomyces sp. NRRL WC-3742 TaxID=1463934 RepID=UPI0004C73F79|nr:hypothetical protein [Streptomyces sp. NRRL WC-3742]